jgi:hypothetical protein
MFAALREAALRNEAMNQIQELTTAPCDHDTREAERSDAVMTDDGGPLGMREEQNPLLACAERTGAERNNVHKPSRRKWARITS